LLDEIETKFKRLPPFSRSAIPVELFVKQLDATGSGQSKIAASKFIIPTAIPSFVEVISQWRSSILTTNLYNLVWYVAAAFFHDSIPRIF